MNFADAGSIIYAPAELGFSPGVPVYLSPEVGLSNEDIAAAQYIGGRDWAGESWIDLQLTPAGSDRIAAFTLAHIGEPMATLVDGRITAIRGIYAQNTYRQTYISGRFTKSEAEKLARNIVPNR